MRLAVVIAHPIQYYSPVFRELARQCDVTVFFGQHITASHHENSGFGVRFEWDVDLLEGYHFEFLENRALRPDPNTFFGCVTPDIGRRLRDGKFDAVLIVGWYQKFLLQTLFAAKMFGLPTLVRGDSHRSTPRGPIKRLLVKLGYPAFLRLYDAALVVGHKSREFLQYHRYPEDRQFLSPHCVDNAWFSSRATKAAGDGLREKLGVSPSTKLVLFAGKLVPFKRPLDVVEALNLVRKSGLPAHLLVAGSGELEEEIRQRAAALAVPVHMLGFQNQTEMPAVYAAADVLVLPSTGRETWGLVCNEALACGTPIIVSGDIGCAPDLAADGAVGRQYVMGDIAELAASMIATLAAPPPSDAVSQLASRYGVESAVTGILAAAQAVCAKRD